METLRLLRQNKDEAHLKALIQSIPYAKFLGIDAEVRGDELTMILPFHNDLVGNVMLPAIHGGVITSLLDNASGMSIGCHTGERKGMATLDLRIDYMHPATPGEDVYARAECYKITNNIAFVRGIACHKKNGVLEIDDPIATSVATFMITGGPIPDINTMIALAAAGERPGGG